MAHRQLTTARPVRRPRLAATIVAGGVLAAGLAAPAQAQPGVGSPETYSCVFGAQSIGSVEHEGGDREATRTLLFYVGDHKDAAAHTDEDVAVMVRPAGAGDDAWTQAEHADGVPVGTVTSLAVKEALGTDAPAADISIRVGGTEEATARIDLTDLSVTAADGGDLSCASDLQDGQQMAPSVTWSPQTWGKPGDPGRPADGSGVVFASPEADRLPVVTPAGEEEDRTFHWLPGIDVPLETSDRSYTEGSRMSLMAPRDTAGFPAGTHGLVAWATGATMPDALWYSVTGEDEEGTLRTRVAVLQPVGEEDPHVPDDGRPTEAGYWEQFDGYAAADEAAPAPEEDEDQHTVPEKVETGPEADIGLAAAAAGLAGLGGAFALRRRSAR